jgi:hypothetical protein
MNKKLNIAAVQNELTGGSAFFPGYTNKQVPDAPAEAEPTGTIAPKATIMTPVPPVRPVPPVLPVRGKEAKPSLKRVMKSRHPFDIYEDQYHSLRDLAMQERMQGGIGSMSAMVREALDAFIEKRKRAK